MLLVWLSKHSVSSNKKHWMGVVSSLPFKNLPSNSKRLWCNVVFCTTTSRHWANVWNFGKLKMSRITNETNVSCKSCPWIICFKSFFLFRPVIRWAASRKLKGDILLGEETVSFKRLVSMADRRLNVDNNRLESVKLPIGVFSYPLQFVFCITGCLDNEGSKCVGIVSLKRSKFGHRIGTRTKGSTPQSSVSSFFVDNLIGCSHLKVDGFLQCKVSV